MQSRVITHLARKLRSTHRRTKSWKQTAAAHHINDKFAQPSKGLAKLIASGYQPSSNLMARLEYDGAIEKKIRKIAPKMISDQTEAELIYNLEHRTDMKDADPRIIKAFVKLGWLKRTEVVMA